MKDYMQDLEIICEVVGNQLAKAADKLSQDGGKLSAQDADYLDKLTHTMKSVKTTLAMEGYGESGRGGSYRRDAMGRYASRDGGRSGDRWDGDAMRGSYHMGEDREETMEQLRRMMENTSDQRVRKAIREAMEQM